MPQQPKQLREKKNDNPFSNEKTFTEQIQPKQELGLNLNFQEDKNKDTKDQKTEKTEKKLKLVKSPTLQIMQLGG